MRQSVRRFGLVAASVDDQSIGTRYDPEFTSISVAYNEPAIFQRQYFLIQKVSGEFTSIEIPLKILGVLRQSKGVSKLATSVDEEGKYGKNLHTECL